METTPELERLKEIGDYERAQEIERIKSEHAELLACLKLCVREIESAYKNGASLWCPDWLIHKRALEAIAKAENELTSRAETQKG